QSGELGVVVSRQADGIAVVVHTFDRGNVHRRGQVVNDSVQHALHALVLECGTAQHRLDLTGDGTQTQTLVDLGFGELTRLQVLVHELFVGLGLRLHQFFAPLGSGIGQLGGDVSVFELDAVVSVFPID